ncbi:MAG: hypothetical protein ABJA90_04480, partial [Ginsengibacter sp.]
MAAKIQRFFQKTFVKVSLIIVTLFVIALTCLYIWFIHNANRLLTDLVDKRSQGKLKLEVSHVNFDFFSNEVKIKKAKIASTSNDKTKVTYRVSFQKISLTTNSLFSAFFNNALEIRKIKLYDPVIEVFSRQKDSTDSPKDNLTLSLELGKLYHSVEDAITTLNTHSISLINATLILNNRPDQEKKPLVFSNIYFSLKKLNKHNGNKTYLDNNNILFSSSNQNITLTDGIHQLQFKRLVIEKARNIILDSCTIIALPTENVHSSYNIHFKRLALIGVDFNALSRSNRIKADSVYCVNPIADLNLNSALPGTDTAKKRGMPDPEKMLREFAGDLDLGFLGVMNADLHFNITGRNLKSNIHSGRASFQIKKLRISPDSSRLISMDAFNMLIKGYKLYNKDSSCIYSFDSVRFANNKLLLNNFSVNTFSSKDKIRSYRNYTMPYFELLGVDWAQLIFEQTLKADEAMLVNPVINYKKNTNVQISKKSLLLTSHQNFDDLMDIGKLNIVNGNVNIEWGENKSLQLQGFNVSLFGNNLSDYKHVRLQKDIESLFFQNGYLHAGELTAALKNITFKTNDQVHADQLTINNEQGAIDSKLNDVSIDNIYSEGKGEGIVIDGLQWADGNIKIKAATLRKVHKANPSILLKNVLGKNTAVAFSKGGMNCNAFVTTLQISSFEENNDGPISINKLKLNGREMEFSNATIKMNSEKFDATDDFQEFKNIHFEKKSYTGTLVMDIPSTKLTNNLNLLFKNDLSLKNIVLVSPVIDFEKQSNPIAASQRNSLSPSIKIDHISIHEPSLNLQLALEKKISIPYSKGSEINADNIQISSAGTSLENLNIKSRAVQITGTGKTFSVDNGIDASLSKINLSTTGDSVTWNAVLTKLNMKNNNGFTFDIKKSKLFLKDISIENCKLSSYSLNNINQLITSNESAEISTSAATYSTNKSLLQVANVSFNTGLHLLKMDGIKYNPSMSRDSLIASNPYQIDYLNFSAGKTRLDGFDLLKYLKQNSFSVKTVSVSQPMLTVYRDKLPPFQEGIRKGLFTEKIRSIPFPLSIGEVVISDGEVSYTEKNEKNRLEGNLSLTHL